MPPKDVVKLAHELLSRARDEGAADATWEDIFKRLRKKPEALKKPPERKMTLLHQAAYWGHETAVRTLLDEFNADPTELTTDGESNDAAGVAASQGYKDLAEVLRKAGKPPEPPPAKKAKLEAAAAASSSSAVVAAAPAAKEPSPEDVKLAHELLSRARDEGDEDAAWLEIFDSLRGRPLALVRPAVRKYSLLHQAAHWGKKAVVQTLLQEFGADPKDLTADGEALDAAGVADSRGHKAVAALVREHAAKQEKGGSGPVAAPVEEEELDESSAQSPYNPAKAEGNAKNSEPMVGDVGVWLCLRKDGKTLRWEPYSAAQNLVIQAARVKAQATASVEGGRTLKFGPMREAAAGGQESKICTFRVIWEWDKGEGGKAPPEWTAYPAEAQFALEAAMCAADAICEVAVANTKKYTVDLVGLRQYSSEDAFRCRRVRRRGVPLRDPLPAHVRDVRSDAWLDLTYQPDYWTVTPGQPGNAPMRYDLPPNSEVYGKICDWINLTIRQGHCAAYGQVPGYGGPLKGIEVVRVEVVQQPQLWRRYLCYKGKMKAMSKDVKSHEGTGYLKKNPMAMPSCEWLDQDVNEAYFWHGSGKSSDGSVDLIDAIVAAGHEPSDENSEVMEVSDGASSRFAKNSSMFGSGVYLADISSKANLYVPCPVCFGGAYFRDPCHCSKKEVDGAQPYRMLLCRAVLGRVYVERKYSDERYKGEFNPALKLGVESVMGESKPGQLAFREYVVYNDSASYPEFVVHFRRLSKKPPMPKKKAKKG